MSGKGLVITQKKKKEKKKDVTVARQAFTGFKAYRIVGFENEANHVSLSLAYLCCANDKRGTNIIITCIEGDNNSYSFLSCFL